MKVRSKLTLGGIIVALVVFLCVSVVYMFSSRIGVSQTAADAPLSDLPSDARDVRWFLPGALGPNKVYDFATTEQGFQHWVSERSRPKLSGPQVGPRRILIYDHPNAAFKDHDIPEAISYTWSENDQGVYMVYDPKLGRAYFHSHSR